VIAGDPVSAEAALEPMKDWTYASGFKHLRLVTRIQPPCRPSPKPNRARKTSRATELHQRHPKIPRRRRSPSPNPSNRLAPAPKTAKPATSTNKPRKPSSAKAPANRESSLSVNKPATRKINEASHSSALPGKLLDTALEQAGIDRAKTYVTNAVKHFKWEPRGKRRIHKKPNGAEIAACRPWLDTEIALLKPEVVVCLGATAAQTLLGRTFRVTQSRGKLLESALAPHIMATVHPSSILRAPDDESRHREMANFVADLKKLAKFAKNDPLTSRPNRAKTW
jgi:uracil-DNA glycosylase family 4